jgi:hypothetical protein
VRTLALHEPAQLAAQRRQVGHERHGQRHHHVQLAGQRGRQHALGHRLAKRDKRKLAARREQHAGAQRGDARQPKHLPRGHHDAQLARDKHHDRGHDLLPLDHKQLRADLHACGSVEAVVGQV